MADEITVTRNDENSRYEATLDGKVAALESTYLAVVRAWGQSIESSDSFTFGHCERVARNAVAVARILGLDATAERTILLGAYLHDVGMVRVPHELLHKADPLSSEEMDERLSRVLTNDPGIGVARHADAGYEEAIETAHAKGLHLPMEG